MENLTGGTPPVRYLPCVVPCKLYFACFNMIVICVGFVIYEIVKRKPPRIYFLYGAGIIASMIVAVLLRQKWVLSVGMVVYGLLRREVQRRGQDGQGNKLEDDFDESGF